MENLVEWSQWQQMPSPEACREITGPIGPGVYQIRHRSTKQLVQFGISKTCQKRMKSFFPKPFGSGTRKNERKRTYVLENWHDLEYRTLPTTTRELAEDVERQLKSMKNHRFNT